MLSKGCFPKTPVGTHIKTVILKNDVRISKFPMNSFFRSS